MSRVQVSALILPAWSLHVLCLPVWVFSGSSVFLHRVHPHVSQVGWRHVWPWLSLCYLALQKTNDLSRTFPSLPPVHSGIKCYPRDCDFFVLHVLYFKTSQGFYFEHRTSLQGFRESVSDLFTRRFTHRHSTERSGVTKRYFWWTGKPRNFMWKGSEVMLFGCFVRLEIFEHIWQDNNMST